MRQTFTAHIPDSAHMWFSLTSFMSHIKMLLGHPVLKLHWFFWCRNEIARRITAPYNLCIVLSERTVTLYAVFCHVSEHGEITSYRVGKGQPTQTWLQPPPPTLSYVLVIIATVQFNSPVTLMYFILSESPTDFQTNSDIWMHNSGSLSRITVWSGILFFICSSFISLILLRFASQARSVHHERLHMRK